MTLPSSWITTPQGSKVSPTEAAQAVPFGEAPLLGYLAARETEYTNIRILLMGRGAGLPAEVIRSRLRNGYV